MFWYNKYGFHEPAMSLIQRLLSALGIPRNRKLSFELEEERLDSLEDISEQEHRSTREVAADLLADSLERRKDWELNQQRWDSLSPREKQITALVCLGYTNPQIAARLRISVETVRTHIINTRVKFNAGSKNDLRVILADWDFSSWEDSR
jgi:DNA-binding CsgD family transcriptional regulator